MSDPIPNRTIPPFVRSVDDTFPSPPASPPTALPVSKWVTYMHSSGAPKRTVSPTRRKIAQDIWKDYDEKREQRAKDQETLLRSTSPRSRRLETRRNFITNSMRFLMRSPWAPLVFRVFVISDSIIALGIAARIVRDGERCLDKPTHYLAIIVNSIAVPYTCYISWDEFFSKPLGLRRSRSKLRLLVLDLVFIIFESSNLSLAFDALDRDCDTQIGLVLVLSITLIAWVSTFLLSLYRLMFKVEGDLEGRGNY